MRIVIGMDGSDNAKGALRWAVEEADLHGVGVRASGRLDHAGPGRALVERSDGATLVVVGSRGQGRISSLLLGSVTRQLLHHAACPVVVI